MYWYLVHVKIITGVDVTDTIVRFTVVTGTDVKGTGAFLW